jgi:hypothetical protein
MKDNEVQILQEGIWNINVLLTEVSTLLCNADRECRLLRAITLLQVDKKNMAGCSVHSTCSYCCVSLQRLSHTYAQIIYKLRGLFRYNLKQGKFSVRKIVCIFFKDEADVIKFCTT